MHRSVDPGARLRYANVATIVDRSAWQAAVAAPRLPGREQPGARHAGLFELVRGSGERDDTGPTVIAPYDWGDEESVLAAWNRACGESLHRSVGAAAAFGFVELSRPDRRSGPATMAAGCHPAVSEVVAR